jgi:hypothetical protein
MLRHMARARTQAGIMRLICRYRVHKEPWVLHHPVGRPSEFQSVRSWRLGVLMRLNLWIVLGILIVLVALTRYMQQKEVPPICIDTRLPRCASGES